MCYKYPRGSHVYLVAILIAATVITTAGAVLTYRNAVKAAEDSLKLQAIGIAVSLEASLKDSDELRVKNYELKSQKNIFKDIITKGRWEGIAFIALYDKNGMTILHSNENLIGRKIQDNSLRTVAGTGKPVYNYTVLGTNENVFVLDFPVHMLNADVVRVALHTYPAEGVIRQSKLHILGMLFVIIILWVVGYFFIRALRHYDELRIKMTEKERLAVIGEMASVLAHEIRNPLGSIKGFAQYLIEGQGSGTEGARITKEYLDIIVSESRRLEALTEDLLMYAKPVEVKSEEFGVLELINEVIKTMQSHENVDIRISVSTGITIKSDRDKLKQILMNIIHNSLDAVKDRARNTKNKTQITDNGGIIEIETEVTGDKVIITVKDNGCGMDEETKGKVFKPFFTTKAKGTGLGLAIVDKLVKSIGGSVEVESEPQKGTVFRVVIPRNFI